MAGFFSRLFGGGNRTPRTRIPGPYGPGTDARRRTPNAEETGRFAIPRPVTQPGSTTPPAVPPPLPVDAPALAREAAARQRKKGRSQRASALLGNTGAGAAAPVLNQRTLLGG